MNDLHKSKLTVLSEDKIMLEAIRAVITERIEQERPSIANENSNELLGEKYRAYMKAKDIFIEVMIDIESYKDNSQKLSNLNRGK